MIYANRGRRSYDSPQKYVSFHFLRIAIGQVPPTGTHPHGAFHILPFIRSIPAFVFLPIMIVH